jgi:hypothetical protein
MAQTLQYTGVIPSGSAGSIPSGSVSPSGGTNSTYGAPWIRLQKNTALANNDNVVDLIMPGGPNNPATWYCIVYTYSTGTGLIS